MDRMLLVELFESSCLGELPEFRFGIWIVEDIKDKSEEQKRKANKTLVISLSCLGSDYWLVSACKQMLFRET